jgi:NADH:ubiquinone oxidoreductase subunit
MGILSKIFTWWDGATIGTHVWSARNGEQVGTDFFGNTYFRSRKLAKIGVFAGRERRWVMFEGANDASRVPAEWHGWLHHTFDGVPESFLPPPRIWEVDYTPNETGTGRAYLPQGALERGGKRAGATGDYEAWSPDA